MQLTIFSVQGRSALITGGGKGLGLVMATTLAQAGADVLIAGRDTVALKQACTAIQDESGRRACFLQADFSRRNESKRLAEAAAATMGKIDILVSNAGTNTPQAIDQITDEIWDGILELNLSSSMALTRALAPAMKQRGWGRIIYISSVMGLASKEQRNAYSATKAALIGLAKAAALDLGPHNVTVNCLAPGPFLTDLPRKVFTQEQMDLVTQRTALLRWGHPPELAGPLLLLASDAGSFITGTTLVVDGGALTRTM